MVSWSLLLVSLVPPSFLFLDEVTRLCPPFRAPRPLRCTCLAPSRSGSWRLGWPLWQPWKTPSRVAFRPYWIRRGSRPSHCSPASPPRSRSPFSKAAPNRPCGSIVLSQRGPTGWSVKSCPAAPPEVSSHRAVAPRPLLLALTSRGARPARPADPPRPCPAPRVLTPCLPPGRQVRGVPQAPLRQGDANRTSTGGERATPSGRCGVRFGVKPPLASPCGLVAMTPYPTSTTPSCFCAPTPSLRPFCCLASPKWTCSWCLWVAGSPWTQQEHPLGCLTHCHTHLGTLFGSKPLSPGL